MSMVYGYIRVSSDKQTVENQRFEINNFCLKESIVVDGWIEEVSTLIEIISRIKKPNISFLSYFLMMN